MKRQLIRLHPDDNVAIALVDLKQGERIMLDGVELTVHCPIRLGHKIALADMDSGQKVYRCGMAIGSATRPVLVGEHVHLHNLKSDYIATLNKHYADREINP